MTIASQDLPPTERIAVRFLGTWDCITIPRPRHMFGCVPAQAAQNRGLRLQVVSPEPACQKRESPLRLGVAPLVATVQAQRGC